MLNLGSLNHYVAWFLFDCFLYLTNKPNHMKNSQKPQNPKKIDMFRRFEKNRCIDLAKTTFYSMRHILGNMKRGGVELKIWIWAGGVEFTWISTVWHPVWLGKAAHWDINCWIRSAITICDSLCFYLRNCRVNLFFCIVRVVISFGDQAHHLKMKCKWTVFLWPFDSNKFLNANDYRMELPIQNL